MGPEGEDLDARRARARIKLQQNNDAFPEWTEADTTDTTDVVEQALADPDIRDAIDVMAHEGVGALPTEGPLEEKIVALKRKLTERSDQAA